ncbi:MAG: NUDIX hydrolase [Actinomycetota bacterium]
MTGTPVPIRDAATVVLLRDGAAGVEAWLLTRVRQMVFAPGMTVFPGGRVDEADASVPWAGRSVPDVAAQLGCDEVLARALIGAAVRETFEETGVLLTVPPADLLGYRADVEAGRVGFAGLLRQHELALDADAVRPWARWITPEGEVRRYDTRFFVAALPTRGVAHDLTTESSVAAWEPVREAIAANARGERRMLPPTIVTLRSIATHATVADVLAAAADRDLNPVAPILVRGPDGVSIELPDGSTVPLPGRTTA